MQLDLPLLCLDWHFWDTIGIVVCFYLLLRLSLYLSLYLRSTNLQHVDVHIKTHVRPVIALMFQT